MYITDNSSIENKGGDIVEVIISQSLAKQSVHANIILQHNERSPQVLLPSPIGLSWPQSFGTLYTMFYHLFLNMTIYCRPFRNTSIAHKIGFLLLFVGGIKINIYTPRS